jgi:hypothetical protein
MSNVYFINPDPNKSLNRQINGNNIFDSGITDQVNLDLLLRATKKYNQALLLTSDTITSEIRGGIINPDLFRELSDNIFPPPLPKRQEELLIKEEKIEFIRLPDEDRQATMDLRDEEYIKLNSKLGVVPFATLNNIVDFEKVNESGYGELIRDSNNFPLLALTVQELGNVQSENTLLNMNAIENFQDKINMNVMPLENFENSYDDYFSSSLLGGPVKEHLNMVPFFGSNPKQNTNDFMVRTKLENFTGNFEFKQPAQKKEVEYMFAPQKDMGYVHGTPNIDTKQYYQGSYKKQGERPFEQIYVGPGRLGDPNDLGERMGTDDKGDGFHAMLRVLPRTVDQLRVKPKVSFRGESGPSKFFVDAPTKAQILQKHLPDRFYSNEKLQHVFTTVAEVQRNALRPEYLLGSREELEQGYTAPAGIDVSQIRPSEALPKFSAPLRSTSQSIYTSPVYADGVEVGETLQRKQGNFITYRNERDTTGKATVSSQNKNPVDKTYFRSMDYKPKDTLRQITGIETRTSSGYSNQKGIANYTDEAKTTLRQLTENETRTSNNFSNQKNIANYTDEAKTTLRQLIEEDNRTGGLVGQKNRIQGLQDDVRTTQKETLTNSSVSSAPQYSRHNAGHTTANYVANPTIREQYSDSYLFNHGHSDEAGMVYDEFYNADTNQKKEVIAQGRNPTDEKAKLWIGKTDINMTQNVMANAYENYENYIPEVRINTAVDKNSQVFTRERFNNRNPNDNYISADLLNAFRENPYTQSLSSYY